VTPEDFEVLLGMAIEQLGSEVQASTKYHGPAELKRKSRNPDGRPVRVKMPCGWCGRPFSNAKMRKHFVECPKRPEAAHAITK
jgi:hypothetical protein